MFKLTLCALLIIGLVAVTTAESKKKKSDDSVEECDKIPDENFVKRLEKEFVTGGAKLPTLFDNVVEDDIDNGEEKAPTPVLADIIKNVFNDLITNPDSPIFKIFAKVKEFVQKIFSFIKFAMDMASMMSSNNAKLEL